MGAPAFDGVIADDYIWGRGALDIKSQMIAIWMPWNTCCEGYKPERTVYLAFGHDEEIGGHGAKEIANFLNDQGIHPAAVLDEGGSVVEGILPGITEPVGLIGVAEKGFMTLRLTVEAARDIPPPHPARPPSAFWRKPWLFRGRAAAHQPSAVQMLFAD